MLKVNGMVFKVVEWNEVDNELLYDDKEIDYRVTQAVKAALLKAKVCKKPFAKHDLKMKQAYLEYSNGRIEYVS